jgi:hypothetical protein
MDGNEPPALANAMPRRFRPEEDYGWKRAACTRECDAAAVSIHI